MEPKNEAAPPADEQPVEVDLEITLKLPLGAVNMILGTLDKNPLGASVMQMAALINAVTGQAQTQVKQRQAEMKKPPPGRVKRR